MAIKNRFRGALNSTAFKNKIIGGDFATNPWQRGTSFSNITSTYTADRWLFASSALTANVSIAKDTDAPTFAQCGAYTSSLAISANTVQSSFTSTAFCFLQQYIEDYNTKDFAFGIAGTRFITVSFWVKSNKTGIYNACIRNSNATRSYVAEFTINASATWEKKVITIPVDTTGTWLYNTGQVGLQLSINLAAGTTYTTNTANVWSGNNYVTTNNQVNLFSTAGNYFKLALVQIEAGAYATDFEQRSFNQELALCQRYYWRWNAGTVYGTLGEGVAETTNVQIIDIHFPTTLRALPACTSSGLGLAWPTNNLVAVTPSFDYPSYTSTRCVTNQSTTTGQAVRLIANNNASAWFEASAEY